MKAFKTSNGYTVKVSDEDYDAVTKHNWYASHQGYVYRQARGRRVRLHREILGVLEGPTVDHADRDPLNNTRENLRIASAGENRANSRKMLRMGRALSKYKGVTRIGGEGRKNRWQAYLNRKYLGVYATQEEAAAVYDAAAKLLFGEYACTNEMLRVV